VTRWSSVAAALPCLLSTCVRNAPVDLQRKQCAVLPCSLCPLAFFSVFFGLMHGPRSPYVGPYLYTWPRLAVPAVLPLAVVRCR
jgi:hypothetical protein